MNKKSLLLMAMAGGSIVPLHAQKEQKMNVLFIMADDLNNNLGCYGHYLVKTPNLDNLASQGMMFNKAYCQLPLSGPSRASLMTGMRPSFLNSICNQKHDFRATHPDMVTLPQYFAKNGYVTARAGKIFHYGVPTQIGTDGGDDTLSWQKRVNPKGRDKWDEDKVINLTPGRGLGTALAYLAADGSDEEQTDGMVASEVIRMMAENKDKPFFIAAGFFRPHCPYVAPKKYFEMYPIDKIKIAENPDNDFDDVPALAHNNYGNNIQLTPEQQKQIHRAYYASISLVDAQVGRLLKALDSLGLSENTIVLFVSDHGYSLGEHYLWQKQNLFEEASRVPLILYNPALKTANHVSNHLVEMLDIYPTLTDMCGISVPKDIHGMSMKCLFEGNDKLWKKGAVTEVARLAPHLKNSDNSLNNAGYLIRGRTVRTERWRYTEWDGGKSGIELYDHQNDPGEFTNLALKPEHKATIGELKKILK